MSRDLHNWNPMQNDYEDPNFNTYKEGPGAHLDIDKQLCTSGKSGSKSGPFKLFVGNIPVNFDKDGIENVFCNVGKPTDVYRKNPDPSASKTWGFVTFATYREADCAVREINMKPPFRLRVEFARDSEERISMNKTRKSGPVSEVHEHSDRRSSVTSEASGKGRGIFMKPFVDPRISEDGVVGRDTHDMSRFQPYGGSNFDETNTSLMCRVQRANGPRGPQKFVMGRGCFDRELDEIVRPNQLKPVGLDVRASLENHVQSVNGQFEYGKKVFPKPDMQGTCTLCGREATQYCQRCRDWYCSRACQETDWPRHRKYCIPPRLVNPKQPDISRDQEDDERMAVGEPRNTLRLPKEQALHDYDDSLQQRESNGLKQSPKGKTYPQKSKGLSPHKNSPKGREEDSVRNEGGHDKSVPSRDFELSKEFGPKKDSGPKKDFGPKKDYVQNRDYGNRNSMIVRGNGSRVERENFASESNGPRNSSRDSRDYSGTDKFRKSSPGVKDHYQKHSGGQNCEFENGDSERNETTVMEGLKNLKIGTNDVKKSSPKAEAVNSNIGMYQLTEELSATTFTKIKVEIPLGPYEFWAQKVDKVHEILRLSTELDKHKNSPQLKPIVGAFCMAFYQGMWFRGKVTSLKPQIMVHYLDFGNEDPADLKDLKELPEFAKQMKAQALRIKFAPGTPDKFKDVSETQTISVKAACKKNDTLIVYVEGQEYTEGASSGEMKSDIALQNIMVLLKTGMPCYLFITEFNDPENFTASFVPRHLIDHYNSLFYGKLKDAHEELRKDKFVPQLGEAVLGNSSEGWIRCYVVCIPSSGEYIVASCDTGIVETVKEIKRMPQKLREIAQFAVYCRILDNDYKARKLIVETKKLSVVVQNATCDSAHCIVENEEGEAVCGLEVRKWSPPFELYEELECIELKDGHCVVVQQMSAVDVYVRPITSSCIELYNSIIQDVPKHCFMTQPLDHVPKVGEVLAAQFSQDKNYYRAVVREVHRTKGVKVQYIDFGNIEYVSPEVLKPLSEKLRRKVCLAVKVKLKDVIEYPLTEDASRYFKDFIVSEKKLSIKLSPNAGNQVHLFESDGSSVNEKLNKMLQPDWKRKVDSDTRIYKIDDVTFETLDIGSTFQLVINSVLSYNSLLVTNEDSKTFRELKTHLESRIAEYCNMTDVPYTPRERELCLAKCDGVWCRCSCLFGGPMLSILSLDSGDIKEISHENIRKMPKDFINLPVCGLFCEIKTSVDCSSEKIQEHMKEYFKIARVITAKIIGFSNSGFLRGYVARVQELDDLLSSPEMQ